MSSSDNLAKARAARSRKAQERRAVVAWASVGPLLKANPCRCGLRHGMTLADLRKLGAGCTAPRYVCPNLDAYRRILEDMK